MARIFLIVAILAVVIGFLLGKTNSTKEPHVNEPVVTLTVGKQVEYGTLFSIAKERGYFAQNGLDVTIKEYESGAPAFKDLLDGNIDMTDAAEFVGVRNSLSGGKFKIISSIGTTTDAWEIVARSDHGIRSIADLRGKKIGVPEKTLGEFFLGNFLLLNQILIADIHLMYITPQDLQKALLDGKIDAAMIFEPYVFELKQQLGERAISWPGQSGRPNYIVLYATEDIVKNNPSAVERFVKSLVQAQKYIEGNDGELKNFMKTHFHYSDAYLAAVLPKFKFFVALEQPMVLLMEDEARWAIDSKLSQQKEVPNYLPFIYFDALEKVKPEAITVIK